MHGGSLEITLTVPLNRGSLQLTRTVPFKQSRIQSVKIYFIGGSLFRVKPGEDLT